MQQPQNRKNMKWDSIVKWPGDRNKVFVSFLFLCDAGHLGIFHFKHWGESVFWLNNILHSIVFQEANFFFLPALPVFRAVIVVPLSSRSLVIKIFCYWGCYGIVCLYLCYLILNQLETKLKLQQMHSLAALNWNAELSFNIEEKKKYRV